MINEIKIKEAFSKIKKENKQLINRIAILESKLENLNDTLNDRLTQLQYKLQQTPQVKPKIKRSTLERRNLKKDESVKLIIDTIDTNKDLCTVELAKEVMDKTGMSIATFYNYLRSLKDKGIIKEKDIGGGNKGYVLEHTN